MIWHTEKPIPDKRCLVTTRHGIVEIATYKGRYFWMTDAGTRHEHVRAWSPLLKPYIEKDEK